MSDTPTTPPTEPTPEKGPEKPAKPPVSRARKWRLRLTRLIVLVVILGLVFRALVYVLFPTVLRKVAGIYGLDATYDRMELYLLGGDVGLWGFKLSPAEGGDPFLTVSYCRGSISTLALLRGRLHVSRAEAEGATLTVDRAADGHLPLLDKLVAATTSAATNAAPAATQSTGNSSISLDPPLFVETLRLQDADMHFTDHAVLPNADVTMKLNMLVSNIGASQQKTSFTIALNSPQTLAALYIDGDGTTSNRQLDANLNLNMFGLNLLPAKQYLAPFGIVPTIKDISGKASGYFQARVTGGQTAGSNAPATQPANLAATLKLTGLSLSADSQPAASVGDVSVQASSLSPGAIVLDQIAVNRVRAAASRTAEGRLSFAGVELDPSAASDAPATQPVAAAPATQPTGPSAIPTVDLKQLKVNDCQFAFTDSVFAQPVVLELNVPKVTVDHISTDPAKANQAAALELSASAPGIAKMIDVHGTAAPAAATKTLNLTVTATGIDGTVLDPYLAVFKLKRDLNDAKFTCKLSTEFTPRENGAFTTGLELKDLALTQAGKSLMAMNAVELKNARIDPAAARISIGRVELNGPTLPLTHDKGNVFAALGLRTDPTLPAPQYATPPAPSVAVKLIEPTTQSTTKSTTTVANSTTQAPAVSLGLPSISIDALSWTGVGISLHDTSADQPVDVGINDLQLHGKNLVFDSSAKNAKPGTVDFAAKIPGIVEDVGINGTISPTGESVAFDVKGNATGISAERLKPLMQALNLEPVLHAGQLVFGAAGNVRQKDRAIQADMKFADVKLSDGARNWLTLGNLTVSKASFDGHIAAVDEVDVDSPVLIAQRDDKGGISVAGVRLMPAANAPAAVTKSAPAATAPPSTQPIAALPIIGRLNAFNLHKAKLQWTDDAVAPKADISAAIDLSAQSLAVGEPHAPSPFVLSAVSPNLIDQLRVEGTVQAAPASQGITFKASGSGLTGAAINPYLPPNFGMILKGAKVEAIGSLKLQQNPAGGLSAALRLQNTSLTDAGMAYPLGGVGSMAIDIDRLDLANRIIAINELSLEHAKLEAWQWNTGASVLGLAFSTVPLRTPKAPLPVAEEQASEDVSDVGALMSQALAKPPLVTIKKMVLHADSLAVLSSQLGRKLELTNSSLWCPGSIELLGDRPQKNPPFELRAFATIDPLVGQINADATLAPFAADPFAKADLNITGLHGDKLTAVLPQLASLINGDDLKDGLLTAQAEAHFKFTRRGALGIDLTRDVGMDAELKNVRLTEAGSDDKLAGLDGIRIEALRYTPTGSAYIKTLEIDKPMVSIVRDAEGIHALGLTLKVGLPPATRPATEVASTSPATTLPAATPAVAIAPATQPAPTAVALGPTPAAKPPQEAGPEYRIDKLTVAGIDLRLEDRLGSTHTVIPVTDLDIEVKGLTNRALVEPNMPIRFSMIANAGSVELPVRKGTSGSAATDKRPVFAEATASGNVTLVPKPNGFLKASISGLELTALRGLASQYNVSINGGTFDGRMDVRMSGADTFEAKLYPTLNEARVYEGELGPIQKFFKWSAPTETVIWALEDEDGSISFPVIVPIEAGKIQYGPIIGTAIGSVNRVVFAGLAAMPAKILKETFGSGKDNDRTKAVQPVFLRFEQGESQLTSEQIDQLQTVIQAMKDDPSLSVTLGHTLGTGDVQLAQTRVNPLKQDTSALAAQYRLEKFDLQKRLSEQTGDARVAMATDHNESAALDQLRATAIQLTNTEDALDQVLQLLRPGADRESERRTKQASILLGDLRLKSVQAALLSSGLPEIDKRVNRSPAKYNPEGDDGHITLVMTHQAKS